MPVSIHTAAILGAGARHVEVQVDLAMGLPGWFIVGLPEGASIDARTRVQTAIRNSGYVLPHKKVTVNLAPGDLRKDGPSFDLPIAIGVLAGAELLPIPDTEAPLVVGELALSGELMPVKGVLPIALEAARRGYRSMIVPAENAAEGALVQGLRVFGAGTLVDAAELWSGQRTVAPAHPAPPMPPDDLDLDMAEVRGQGTAKRALLIAAAGGHNALLVGPPGSGKTMLARRVPTLLPRLSFDESVQTTSLWSIAGRLGRGRGLLSERPFRAPHHTISVGGLIGAGSPPRPGEISLAHNGVLFLDELPEFGRSSLEGLRQPLEDGEVTVVRVSGTAQMPARFMLLASMNPCPCGYEGHGTRECLCTVHQKQRYRARISGPIIDRFDLHVEARAMMAEQLRGEPDGEPSAVLRDKVEAARELQRRRFAGLPNVHCNAHLRGRRLRELCEVTAAASEKLSETMRVRKLSARAHDRILKVARTIADLDGSQRIEEGHINEAGQYRCLDAAITGRDPNPPTETQKGRQGALKNRAGSAGVQRGAP